MPKRSSTGRLDLNQLAKRIVDEATGEAPKTILPEKNPAAVALGRLGGIKGGAARVSRWTGRSWQPPQAFLRYELYHNAWVTF